MVHKESYWCEECDFKTNRVNLIEEHVKKSHFSVKPFTCNQCDYRTPKDSELEEHIVMVHEKSRLNVKSGRKFCAFYNNDRCTNNQCNFEHKDTPNCHNDGTCDRYLCMFQHKKQDFQKWNPVRPAERHSYMKNQQQTLKTAYKGPVWEREKMSTMGKRRY